MIVDDDEGILEVTKIIVENEGYSVDAYSSGDHIYNLKENLPDLIIMDIMLAGQDGRDLCLHLKNKPETEHIPIVLFSANNVENEKLYNEFKPDRFIAKPYDIVGIKNTIMELLNKNTKPIPEI